MNNYRGRFAPSPSGALHIGSLITAISSWCEARSQRGNWLLRIDDLDTPRVKPGAADDILRTLETFGLEWDEKVVFQSKRIEAYIFALKKFEANKEVYRCTCSRKDIIKNSLNVGLHGPIYGGTCKLKTSNRSEASIRISVLKTKVKFFDTLQGEIQSDIANDVGDFVLRRADKIFSYHLANVVDDNWMKITNIVRGIDLLDSTIRQLYLINRLNFKIPNYLHVPIAVNASGQKLSKQTFACPIKHQNPPLTVWTVLQLLNQSPPKELKTYKTLEILAWASENWSQRKLPTVNQLEI